MRSRFTRFVALLLAFALLATLVVGCKKEATTGGGGTTTDVKAAMVTDIGGLGDKSFNDISWDGLKRAESELGVTVKVLESKEAVDYEPNLTQLAEAGYSPVFAVGFLMQDTLSLVATAYPDTVFGGIDVSYDPPIANIAAFTFKEHEAAYLAGIVAGMLTTMTDVDPRINDKAIVGFVGGIEIPPVQRFKIGFEAGVKAANPAAEVKSVYTGTFTDTQKGKEAALGMIEGGADIVFAAAGLTGEGSFAAAQEKNVLFIGVDKDQFNTLTNPGDTIITSAVKKVDEAVFQIVKRQVDGTLKGGTNDVFGLAENAVDLAPYHDWDSKMPQSIKDAVAKAKADIIAGTITVPSQ